MDFGRLITAMVTPFNESLEVDFETTSLLVEHLIEQGNDAIVVAGTTGESPNLTFAEKIKLFETVVKCANGRVKVIAGTGSNNTLESIELSKRAESTGVDGLMLVVPYYNKPSQEGIYKHFKMIAENVSLPIMLYNVPGRTVTNMTGDTVIKLSKIDNIVSIKEASGNLVQISNIIKNTNEQFKVYSGDDSFTLPILSIGGYGIVSVAGHIIGKDIKTMINDYLSGNIKNAAYLHQKLMPVFEGMFITSNPVPVKAALNLKYFSVGTVRPPLADITQSEIDILRSILK